jgi:hypothetical protein
LFKSVLRSTIWSLLRVSIFNSSVIPIGKKTPILAYALPYEDPQKPGRKFYCALTATGVQPEKWGEVYGVKHYIIFYLEIL